MQAEQIDNTVEWNSNVSATVVAYPLNSLLEDPAAESVAGLRLTALNYK